MVRWSSIERREPNLLFGFIGKSIDRGYRVMAKAKVMIAEDEIITAADLRNELQNLGYSICSFATSGEKAIQTAEQEKPDVVLMDIRLKGELNGVEAANEIRSRFGVPIIYMTGYSLEMFKDKAGVVEPYEYIGKPMEIGDIKNAIESVLNKKTDI